MLTIHQMAERTGVTIRALRYYDKIGLLPPGAVSPAGYRLYGPAELERLQQILFFRELEFPLAEIKAILASPAYDRTAALTAQRALLREKRDRLDYQKRAAGAWSFRASPPLLFSCVYQMSTRETFWVESRGFFP